MRNVSGRSCRENQNTHFMFHNFLFENRAVYEIMWKNIIKPRGSPQMWIRRMRISRRIPKATHTLGICNTNCFSVTTNVVRKRLKVTLHVHCLSCYFLLFSTFFVSLLPSVLLRVYQFFPLYQYCVTVLFTLCGTKCFGPLLQHFQQECSYSDFRKGTPEDICMKR